MEVDRLVKDRGSDEHDLDLSKCKMEDVYTKEGKENKNRNQEGCHPLVGLQDFRYFNFSFDRPMTSYKSKTIESHAA